MNAAERNGSERETEVVAKPTRRRFALEYKRRIIREADGCKTPGAVGRLLRREGLYSSHLAVWRGAPGRGGLGGGGGERWAGPPRGRSRAKRNPAGAAARARPEGPPRPAGGPARGS